MIKKLQIKLQKKFALSEKGSKDLIKGCLFCALQNISFMLPVGILFKLVCELKDGGIQNISFYIISCTAALIFIAAATWFQYNSTFFATYIESGVRRITLAERLRKLPLSFFGKKDLADLTNTIMADCTTLETAFSHYICSLAGSFISTAIIGISLFSVNVSMAIAALWVLPISFAIVYFSGDVQDKFNNLSMQAKTDCADGIQECIETVRDLKANNAEEKYLSGLNEKIDNVEKSAFASELATGVFVVSAQLILKFGIATTALTGAVLYKNGSLDMITFFMYLLVVSRLYDPMQATLTNLAAVISLRVNISRMNEILYHPVQTGSETLDNNGTDIVFENVSFSYDDGEKVIENISFTAKQGEVTALVGPSGGGKTTVSRLAARFYDISEGRITVGGVDISTVDPEKLLSLYSIVFQNVLLFNNTVLENIRIGRLGASDEEVIAAAKLANVDEFVEKMPDKWHTFIGENGCELSGGERQRISIARAFLKNAPIILLDEATASLDVENETLIQTALLRLIKNKTVLVIAHRMRTVSSADKIIVLENGTVAESGSPDELKQKGGIFANMLRLQTEDSQWTISG